MKDNLSNSGPTSGMPFLLAQSTHQQVKARPKLEGFAKVLAGGRVVGLKREAPFVDRIIGFDLGSSRKGQALYLFLRVSVRDPVAGYFLYHD